VTLERGLPGQDQSDRIAGTGQLGLNSRERTAGTGQPGQESWDRIVSTGHSRQVGLTSQPGQVSLERTEMTELQGHDYSVRRAVEKVAWGRAIGAGQLGQDS
jgi:hypothetical protein